MLNVLTFFSNRRMNKKELMEGGRYEESPYLALGFNRRICSNKPSAQLDAAKNEERKA